MKKLIKHNVGKNTSTEQVQKDIKMSIDVVLQKHIFIFVAVECPFL